MMMNPEGYKDEQKNKVLEELILERIKLFQEIVAYEKKHIMTNEPFNPDEMVKPNPDVVYNMNNLYLKEITDLILEKTKTKKLEESIDNKNSKDDNLFVSKAVNDNASNKIVEKKIYNNDIVKIDMFGKEKELRVICTGDNQIDENGNYKDYDFELSSEERDVLNWFKNNIKIEDYKQQVVDYCNEVYSSWQYPDGTQEGPIGLDDVENEINITNIAINVTKRWKANDGFVYPEVSFYGWCKCDEEHGICIGFRDKKFLGIHSQDWTL